MTIRRVLLMCSMLLVASTNAQPDHQIHPLVPRLGSAGHPIPGLDCNSWRLAVEANNLQGWKTVPEECEEYVGHYMMGAQYRKDCSFVAAATATAYVSSLERRKDGKNIWIFDIDETSLSNLPYYARPEVGFGAVPYNATTFNLWQGEANAPAIPAVLKLYKRLLRLGIKVVFLSGTPEVYREPKERNMKKIGYHTWEFMILKGVLAFPVFFILGKANETGMKSVEYKSKHRAELVTMGYRIIGNIGDQWSDLLGPYPGLRTFKLPDPMYYIS